MDPVSMKLARGMSGSRGFRRSPWYELLGHRVLAAEHGRSGARLQIRPPRFPRASSELLTSRPACPSPTQEIPMSRHSRALVVVVVTTLGLAACTGGEMGPGALVAPSHEIPSAVKFWDA